MAGYNSLRAKELRAQTGTNLFPVGHEGESRFSTARALRHYAAG